MRTHVGVVFIGRSNVERRSNTLPKIVRRLEDQGFSVFFVHIASIQIFRENQSPADETIPKNRGQC